MQTLRRSAGYLALCLITAFFHGYRLTQNGFGNPYYAAAVRSMRQSVPNFLYAAYDPAGFLSVDKPPVALYVQTLTTFLFGYNGLALLLPQAIAGVLSVLLLARLVARHFGNVAGCCAGLFLALTPITVAAERMNLPDGLLTLSLLLAAWALLNALEEGRTLPLLGAAVCIGLGFNIKIWEAFAIVPGLALAYGLFAPVPWSRRLVQLILACVALCLVSFSWMVLVDMTPATQRPYVGGSQVNSAFDLIFGYNGLDRLRGGANQITPAMLEPGAPLATLANLPGFSAGRPGPFRLLSPQLGPQVMWWAGLAVSAVLVIFWTPLERMQKAQLVVWAGWFVAFGVTFSFASGTVHAYYVTVLAPAVAAFGGIAARGVWEWCNTPQRYRGTIIAIIAGFLQLYLLRDYARNYPILYTGPAVAGVGAILLSVPRIGRFAAVGALCGLCLTPLYWCWTAIVVPNNGLIPSAGPEVAAGMYAYPPPTMPESFTRKLLTFLQQNHLPGTFLCATGSVYNASPMIIQTGLPVMAFGGFLGSDPILTPATMEQSVKAGKVRYILVSPSDGLPGNTYLAPLFAWTRDHGRPVDPALWMEYKPGYGMEYMTLYDCENLPSPERAGLR